jgi:drug/metabolite transporter (DMT)-like permease
VPTASLLLALAAAFVHAGWNLILSRARDSQAATAVAAAMGAVAFIPVAVLTWNVSSQALPYAAGSATLELVYLALLAHAFQTGELSMVYPVARGSAPIIILVVSVAALGTAPSLLAIAGVCLIGAGVMLVRGSAGEPRPQEFRLALAIAASIASYTLLDKAGLRHADALPYVGLVVVPPALVYASLLGQRRGTGALRAELGPGTCVAAVGIFGGFALALTALKLAPSSAVASVQAMRETSVVIAVVLARLLLGERVTKGRLAGATVVLAGIAAIAAG